MTAERFVLSIAVISAGFVLVALAIVGGTGVPLARWAGSFNLPTGLLGTMPSVTLPGVSWPSSWGTAGDSVVFAAGMAVGWILHWLYRIPWAALPQAMTDWLRGWRRSAVLLCWAVACTVILLFY